MENLKSLKEHRRNAVLSVRELAQLAGVSQATVSRIEAGSVKNVWPSTQRALAGALGVHPTDISEFVLPSREEGPGGPR